MIGADPPKAGAISAGDASVSMQTGAFDYAYPIDVPPGRNGMQPKLALSYSSQGAIYGGIANGWSMPLPVISYDTTRGRLWQENSINGGARYITSLGAGRVLVPVNEPIASDASQGYRAKNDSSFTRYEQISGSSARINGYWRAQTPDGLTYQFGQLSHVDGTVSGGTACGNVNGQYAPLTQTVDSFGNAVDYYYEAGLTGECRIAVITWGENAAASVSDFARIKFNYSVTLPSGCPAGALIGAQISYRDGVPRITGESQLDSIVVTAYAPGQSTAPVHTRTITLGYTSDSGEQTASCTSSHAGYRSLFSIHETAVGTDSPLVDLPPIKFGYGSAQFGTGTLTLYPGSQTLPWPAVSNVPSAGANYNLGWGYRFDTTTLDGGRWPTVEATMVDIDGDGLLDRLYSAPLTSAGTYYCHAQWLRNTGSYHFDPTPRDIPMPTIKWASPDGTSCSSGPALYAGSPTPNAYHDPGGAIEGCALNYQRTNFKNTSTASTYACHSGACGPNGYCDNTSYADYGTSCDANPTAGPTYLSYRWFDANGDGLVDLIASPSTGSQYNLEWGGGLCGANFPSPEPTTFGAFPRCPSQLYGEQATTKNYSMCERMYPWVIYFNKGNGQFGNPTSSLTTPVPDTIIYQPIPLESDSGDSSLTASPVGQDQGMLDIDGDGYADGAFRPFGATAWDVYRNDTNGKLSALSTPSPVPFLFEANSNDLSATTPIIDSTQHVSPESTTGIADFNGDGLPDLWTSPAPSYSTATLYWNDGLGFTGARATSTGVRPGNDGTTSCYGGCTVNYNHNPSNPVYFSVEAQRTDSRRVVDADLDGRPDVMVASGGTYQTYFNEGALFRATTFPSPGDVTSLSHKMVVTNQMAYPNNTWEVRSDVTDLDGDGIPENVSFGDHTTGTATMTVSKVAPMSSPPRLMNSVSNGHGATTTIAYAPISDTTVVTRDAGLVMPRTEWVVKSLTTVDSVAATTSTTTYAYKNPHFSAEGDLVKEQAGWGVVALVNGPLKDYGFRGFDEVTMTNPAGAKTIERYRYDVDWSGRLVTTLQIPAEAPGEVRSIDDTTWEARYLFCDPILGCSLKTYHATAVDHWICKNGQTEATCRTNTDTVTHTFTTLSGLASTTAPGGPWLLYKETSSRLSTVPAPGADGDRITSTSYVLAADGSNYRLMPASETLSVVTGGTPVAISNVVHTFDANNLVAVTDDVWLKSDNSSHAITRRVYDMSTGNVLQTRRPNQEAINGPYTTLTYDARRLFPTMSVNELGHELDFTYEYGTGTKLETQGPNTATCVAANTCPAGSVPKQDERIRVDGLGRTIETYEAISATGSSYVPQKIGIDSYVDNTIPSSVTRQQAYAVSGSGVVSYARSMTTLDGHGRPITLTSYVAGSAPVDAVTTYHYGNDGTLQSVTSPDPTANDASTVTYTYAFDSLGRPTTMRRPDSSVLTTRSGVTMTYDGLTATTSETVNTGDGTPATTRETHDAFGRLVKVEEALTGAPVSSWAATMYAYDGADRVTQVTDPQNVITQIQYDFAGRRTAIVRPAATWAMSYDADDNVTSMTAPHTCASGDPCDARYVTTFAYDALDRMTSKLLAHRDISAADLALFGADKETFIWDAAISGHSNTIGQQVYWRSYAPGAPSYTQQRLVYPDAQGRNATVVDNFRGAGYSIQRQAAATFAPNGDVSLVHYDDAVGGTNATTATYAYDARGLPSSISLVRGGVATAQTIAVQTRNVAGLVTKRRTDQTGAMTFIESNWTYDKVGRVTRQLVQKGPGPVTVAEQDLAYFGNDDPKTLDQYLGARHTQLQYVYDFEHQLKTARENTTAGAYFNASYTYGTSGRLKTALEQSTAPGPGSEVAPRNVTYQYAGGDPEEVTALMSGTAPFVGYAYDGSGNMIARCTGGYTTSCAGQSIEYLYDGQDRLRRATNKLNGVISGSEEYWYDGTGQRVATVKRDAQGTKTELIAWLGDTESHYDGTGVLQNTYSYVTLGTPVARVNRTGGTTATLEYDSNGLGSSTLAAVDSSGVVNAAFSYAPFGEVLETMDGGGVTGVSGHRRRLNDKYVDEATSLAYYGARFYDKTLIGWTQMDPLYRYAPDSRSVTPRRGNLFAFSRNNPMRYVDPDGRDSFGADEFLSHTSPNSVAGVGETIEGGGWGAVRGEGETLDGYRRIWGHMNRASNGALGMAAWRADKGWAQRTMIMAGFGLSPPGLVSRGRTPGLLWSRTYDLNPQLFNILAPTFKAYFNFDIGKVSFRFGATNGQAAITVGNLVTLDEDNWNKLSQYGRAILAAHELTHSVQFEALGRRGAYSETSAFAARYFPEWFRGDNYTPPPALLSTPLQGLDVLDASWTLDQIAERVAHEFTNLNPSMPAN